MIEEGRVYVHFGSYGTAALDTRTGKVLWERRDLPCNHWQGPGSSPILHGDLLLIVHFDGFDVQYAVALDKRTGRTVWRSDRTHDFGTGDGDQTKGFVQVKAGEAALGVITRMSCEGEVELLQGTLDLIVLRGLTMGRFLDPDSP